MFILISKFLALLPLAFIHQIGKALGWALYLCNLKSARIQYNNILQSRLYKNKAELKQLVHANIKETGKSILESLAIWSKNESELSQLIKNIDGWDDVEAALSLGKGIIFLTPHLGCFEITSIFYGSRHPITILYRPPKLKLLEEIIIKGRSRRGVTLAEANAAGVRKLMQALKRGEAIGILPDQVPEEGEGEWANFFEKPAYTMTLASKLAEKTGASIMMAFGERLNNGDGYHIHIKKIDSIATTVLLNLEIEHQVAEKPEQYLWQYNRYKTRRHAMQKLNAPKE
jgi:KDO2-lipid IV(A) lauroyltransferase